jgi:hypothetical protein
MKRFLDKFILHIPTLFIKQYPYAWLVVVALWSWPPNVSAIFFSIVLIGILSLRWRETAWISEMRHQHAPGDQSFYIDRPPVPIQRALRNLAMLVVVCILVAWFMHGIFNLGLLQTFIMLSGFAVCYIDTRFFGAVTVYIVTGGGIAIYYVPYHTDYRIFLRFNEMRQVERMDHIGKIPETWSVLSRVKTAGSGVLLLPRSPKGFTRILDGDVLLTPTNVDEFLKHIPSTLVTIKKSG